MHASAGWYGDHTVDATSDGVTVRKGLDLDTLALPALKFEIRSERDHPVGVRVVDTLPSTMNPSRVGLHADFGADQWTAFEDGRITFTTRLDPERPVVTLYGVWLDDPTKIHELLGRPSIHVSSDPDAPALDPTGAEVEMPTVDESLRSVGPDALEDLRNDVEDALTAVRAEPKPTGTSANATDPDTESADNAETMGELAWTYPVEREGVERIAAPTHADLDELLDGDDPEGHVYVRAALTETHHGGGAAILLQELANAFEVVARRVTGDSERATVDAVVDTPLGTDAVLQSLSDREQVSDALVSPLVGDREDATGIDATPASETATADREDTSEVSVEPDSEDVELVLNEDGERFAELQAEFDREEDTDALESELQDLELPGVDVEDEPTIDELLADTDSFDEADSGFVPANVEGSDDDVFEFDTTDDTATVDGSADPDLEFDGETDETFDIDGEASLDLGDEERTPGQAADGSDDGVDAASGLDFASDAAGTDTTEDGADVAPGPDTDAESEPAPSTESAGKSEVDAEGTGEVDAEGTGEVDAESTSEVDAEGTADAEEVFSFDHDGASSSDTPEAASSDDDPSASSTEPDEAVETNDASSDLTSTTSPADSTVGDIEVQPTDCTETDEFSKYVTVPRDELVAMRAELRELRDRVAALESELDSLPTVRDDERTDSTRESVDEDGTYGSAFETAAPDRERVEQPDGGVRPSDVRLDVFDTTSSGDDTAD